MAVKLFIDRLMMLVLSHRGREVVDTITGNFLTFVSLQDMNLESTDRDRRRNASLPRLAGLSLAATLPLVGCSHAPEYSIFGSFFPVWIFCAAGGILLTTGAHALIARTAIAEHLAAPTLLYLSMATFFACVLWLVFYS